MSDGTLLHPTHRRAIKVQEGRTFTSTHEGTLIWAQAYPTPEAAHEWANAERANAERKGWKGWEFAVI